MFNLENLLEIFNQYKDFALLISLIMSILIALSGIIPSVFVTGANIIFFGPLLGFTISLLGETIGGWMTFKIYRLGLKSVSEKIKGKYALIDKILMSNGLKAGIFIFEGRIIPFIPSGFVTLAASISNVNDKIFILSTFLGKIPSIALETLVSYDLINIQENYIRLSLTLVALLSIFIYMKLSKPKERN
ncbi:MAG: VTT domain-containing protein [Clostridium sp.]|nr:VTT domain-containing protein [Clostridium sp.]MDU7084537.1 VTT domain-containing protein [Clostridium sp.]